MRATRSNICFNKIPLTEVKGRGMETIEEAPATDQIRADDGLDQSGSNGGGETGLDSGCDLKWSQ